MPAWIVNRVGCACIFFASLCLSEAQSSSFQPFCAQNASAHAEGLIILPSRFGCSYRYIPSRETRPEPTECTTHKCGLSDAFERGSPDPETRSCAPRALAVICHPPPVAVARIRPGTSDAGNDVNEVNRVIWEIAAQLPLMQAIDCSTGGEVRTRGSARTTRFSVVLRQGKQEVCSPFCKTPPMSSDDSWRTYI